MCIILRFICLLLLSVCIGCSSSLKDLDVERLADDADMLFAQYPPGTGLVSELPETVSYLKSLMPESVYLGDHSMSLELNAGLRKSIGIVVARKGIELNAVLGSQHEILSERVFRLKSQ